MLLMRSGGAKTMKRLTTRVIAAGRHILGAMSSRQLLLISPTRAVDGSSFGRASQGRAAVLLLVLIAVKLMMRLVRVALHDVGC